MKIYKLEIENFRLLKNFSIDLEKELSLVIGKNNTGKTSILSVLNKFLNYSEKNKFSIDDFNIEFKKSLEKLIEDDDEKLENDFDECGLKLKVFIQYFEGDYLANISEVMMSLDPENNIIVLGFEYILTYDEYVKLRTDFRTFKAKEESKKQDNDQYVIRDFCDFLKQNHATYFTIFKKSYEFDISNKVVLEESYIDLGKENISLHNIINFKYISAKRDVTNKEIDKTLSSQTSKIYAKTETNEDQNKAVEKFKDRLSETDTQLSDIYSSLFKEIIDKVKDFGGIRPSESEIEIISTLQHRELLHGNTTVVYKHDENTKLPEHFNGLGYMNLISLIFEIEILVREFQRQNDKIPADLNLLFIEEPEAHTHPQMQYIFIKNIKGLLEGGIKREDGQSRELQYIISTHSSHIVADSDFNDIKYLKRQEKNAVIAKNIKDLEKEYSSDGEKQNFHFLKQYLTLNRTELFFADKAIFIEGDTERILLPAMMKKIDQELPENPLLSQNISIVEVGAHSQIFEKFINFIGLTKAMIITDIDSYFLEEKIKDGKSISVLKKCSACEPDASHTSNHSLLFFHSKERKDLKYFKELSFEEKKLTRNENNTWEKSPDGCLMIAYQIKEKSYHARSFEDAFIHLNKDFITCTDNSFPSIKPAYLKKYEDEEIGVFEFANKAINKKTSFAIEVLLNSKKDDDGNKFINWEIPAYIKEGLTWLKED